MTTIQAPAPAAPAATGPAASAAPSVSTSPGRMTKTRIGVVWWALGFSMALLIVTMVFVLQNLGTATLDLFTVKWTIPLGLDLLLAALLGGAIVFLMGAARIAQLRLVARRLARAQH